MPQTDTDPQQNTENTVKIAIAGHTNTGKTTLIRTLMRLSVGEVKDAANVTRVGADYHCDGLQATFVDTPGFQHPLAVSMYLEAKEEDKNYNLSTKLGQKLNFDMDAINSLKQSDIVIYVGSLSVVPDDSYKEEIEIIKKIQPKVVAILSQRGKQIRASGEAITNDRISQWQEVLKEQKIENIVVFDAHWDRPGKIDEIHDSLSRILAERERKLLEPGIKIFKQRYDDIYNKAICNLSDCIEACQKKSNITFKKSEFDESKAKETIAKELRNEYILFMGSVAKLYKIGAEHPTEADEEELKIQLKKYIDFGNRMEAGAGGVAVGGGVGGFIGACIGGVLAGLFAGGLGAVGGAAIGAQWGTSFGAAFGGLGIFFDDGDTIKIKVTSEIIRDVAEDSLAVIWGLSNIGFGRGSELYQIEVQNIQKEILDRKLLPSDVDWTQLSKEEIIVHCQHALDILKSVDCN